jgi:hypothetical protein
MSQEAINRATDVKRKREKELMSKLNVVAVGVGFRQRGGVSTNEVSIVVSVRKKLPQSQLKPGDVIPASIDGVPVDVIETGEIRALGSR